MTKLIKLMIKMNLHQMMYAGVAITLSTALVSCSSGTSSSSNSNNSAQSPVAKWENAALVQSFNAGDNIWSISFGSSNKVLATKGSTEDKVIKIWDAENSNLKQQFPLYRQNPSSEPGYLAIPHDDVVFFNSKGNLLGAATGGQSINECVDSECSSVRTVQELGGPVKVWDLETGSLEQSFAKNSEIIVSTDLSKNETLLATGNETGGIKLWDFSSREIVHTLPSQSDDPVWEVEFGPDGEMLVSTNGDALKLWNTKAGSLKESIDTDASAVEFSPKDKVVAVGSGTGVKICRIESNSSCQSFAQAEHTISSLAFSPDGKFLATASGTFRDREVGKGTVKVWNFETGELITTLSRMETNPVVDIGPNGEKIAIGGGKGRVKIWEISD